MVTWPTKKWDNNLCKPSSWLLCLVACPWQIPAPNSNREGSPFNMMVWNNLYKHPEMRIYSQYHITSIKQKVRDPKLNKSNAIPVFLGRHLYNWSILHNIGSEELLWSSNLHLYFFGEGGLRKLNVQNFWMQVQAWRICSILALNQTWQWKRPILRSNYIHHYFFYIRAGKKMNIQYTVQYQCTHYSDYSWS